MKKTILILSILLLSILLIICVALTKNQANLANIQKANLEYETYKEKEVFGTEVASVIHKATDHNLKHEIKQDEKGFFIPNETNSIKVEIKLQDEKELKTYQMETIQKVGTEGFIKNFNLIQFKCTNIEYHNQTKRVAKLVFEQIEE